MYELDEEGYIKIIILPRKKVTKKESQYPEILEIDTAFVEEVPLPRSLTGESFENQNAQPYYFYGKLRQHLEHVQEVEDEQPSTNNACFQITLPFSPTPKIEDLKKAFAAVTSLPAKNLLLYHLSYHNTLKFGIGDIKLPDGRVGRFLDPDSKSITGFQIKNGDFFEIDQKRRS